MRFAFLSTIALATSILAACHMGPSPERVSCMQSCARQKDACMLEAANAAAVSQCDGASHACGEGCP